MRILLDECVDRVAEDNDARAYRTVPVEPDEFSGEEEFLDWDAGGWDEIR